MNVPRNLYEEKTLKLFTLGLEDKNSTFSHLTSDIYYDMNITGIIKDFLVTGFSIEKYLEYYSIDADIYDGKLYVLEGQQQGSNVKIFSSDCKKYFGCLITSDLKNGSPFSIHIFTEKIHIVNRTGYIEVIDFNGKIHGEIGRGILRNPAGIVHDPFTNRIFVTDIFYDAIFVFEDDKFLFRFCRKGGEKGELYTPVNICINSENHELFVLEYNNNRVSVFSIHGKFLRCFGTIGYQKDNFFHPMSIDYNPLRSEIIVCDRGNHRLQVFNRNGKFLKSYGKLANPLWVCVKNNQLYYRVQHSIACMFL